MKFARFFILTLLSSDVLFAQESRITDPRFVVKQYTDEDGLPQNSIKGISSDRNGFIWVATEEGISRYDGRRFVNFSGPDFGGDNNRVVSLMPSVKNTQRYADFFARCVGDRVLRVTRDSRAEVTDDDNQELKRRVHLGKNDKRLLYTVRSLPYFDQSPSSSQVSVMPTSHDRAYLWTPGRISAFAGDRIEYEVSAPEVKYLFMIGKQPYTLNKTGESFQKLTNRGLMPVRLSGDILEHPSFPRRNFAMRFMEYNGKERELYTLFWNNISNQAFLYLDKKLYYVTESSGTLATRCLLNDFDIKDLIIESIMLDERSGTLYLGSSTDGLFILQPNPFHIYLSGKVGNVFYGQVPAGYESLVTPEGFQIRFDTRQKTFTSQPFLKPVSLRTADKYFITRDSAGNFYALRDKLLVKYDKAGQLVQSWPDVPGVKALYSNGKGRLWIGDVFGGLFWLDTESGNARIRRFKQGPWKEIVCMKETADGTLWLGTPSGLFRLNTNSGHLAVIEGTEGVYIRSMHFNRHGIWMSTYHSGIMLLPKGKPLVRLPADHDNYLSLTHCILEDQKGFLWMTTNKGLFQIKMDDLLAYAAGNRKRPFYFFYDKNQGLYTNEFNGGCQPCAAKMKNGYFSLPSINGLQWFNPLEIEVDVPRNGLFISALFLDGKPIQRENKIALPNRFDEFRVDVSCPYYGNRKNLVLEYAIVRSDAGLTWLPLTVENSISLSQLPYGHYTVKIRKKNGFGQDNYVYKDLEIEVLPAWYETFWFKILFFAALVSLVILVIRLRISYLLRKDEESKLYRQAYLQGQMLAVINHDIQTPLRYLVNSLEQVNSYLAQPATDPVIRETSRVAYLSARQIKKFTSNLLIFIKTQINGPSGNIISENLRVQELLEGTLEFFSAIIQSKELAVRVEALPGLTVHSNKNLISVILHNLIDNALKNTHSGEVVISSSRFDDAVVIKIADNGSGINKETIDWLNSSAGASDYFEEPDTPDGIGIGLVIVKDLCAMLNIGLYIESNEGQGTIVRLIFPAEAMVKIKRSMAR
ncbi:ligand-binding sensor domain-containing protein [Dyadobacter aurulentus]|uniref:ligand-binding sensor domain-containing protein n=1 Tax=Dyadobacter sp. UC 10 TaxID=2605428 RepID=UPI0011F267E0|nr:sensor histidine kinase [Dyadobacter sp. UC 10]KAA0989095.1 hypothetical protein FXO21_02405 [Dyadobacter sp. UC 10]